MYAIVRTGGKQYRVDEGRTVTVERLPAEEGATVELGDVLLIVDDGEVTVGTPTIEGARVLAQVEAHGRAPKIIVFKYRAKVRTRKKTGHRQHFTRLAVREILRPGQQPKEEKPERRRRRKAAEEAVEVPAAEATAPAKRRTRRAKAPTAEAPAEAPTPAKRRTRRAKAPTAEAPAEATAPAKRRTRRAKAPAAEAPAEAPAPAKRRTRRAKAPTAEAPAEAPTAEVETAAPKRRSTRRKTSEETE